MATTTRMAPRGRGIFGFTLVEMLVVIGVISILAGMLMVALGRASGSANLTACTNNLRQIYIGARTYSNYFGGFLPDPYVNMMVETEGAWAADADKCLARYVQNHHVQAEPRGTEGPVTKVPSGLWLLRTTKFVDAEKSFYCSELAGPRRYNGSENTVTDGTPVMVGYAYNFFPHLVTGTNSILFPDNDPIPEDMSNNINEPRDMRFYAFLSDLFQRPDEMSHRSRNAINCCFWDGSMQLIDLTTRRMGWNGKVENEEGVDVDAFTTDRDGAIAVRDSWVLLSSGRR